jgi:hypothetical protein
MARPMTRTLGEGNSHVEILLSGPSPSSSLQTQSENVDTSIESSFEGCQAKDEERGRWHYHTHLAIRFAAAATAEARHTATALFATQEQEQEVGEIQLVVIVGQQVAIDAQDNFVFYQNCRMKSHKTQNPPPFLNLSYATTVVAVRCGSGLQQSSDFCDRAN